LFAYPRVIWVVGGQLKGVDISELTASVADLLAGAVLLGVDRAEVAAALARHAPEVPVVDVSRTDDGAMADVVRAAAAGSRPGDTVLLAPAAASGHVRKLRTPRRGLRRRRQALANDADRP
jgi:UDP-N-acetylmuramoylalanine--D-glutamate ligase